MKFIIGKKLHMTQIFSDDGRAIPVTAVLAQPNVVAQIKTTERDGYSALQVGALNRRKINKPESGHLKDLQNASALREVRMITDDITTIERGAQFGVALFEKGDKVTVTGRSKGKGFQGVVKRHGFHGQKASHGHKDQERMPGSIGAGGVQRVFKNVRMAGHMGDERVTISGLEVIDIDAEQNLLFIKGAVPGSRNSLVMVYGPGDFVAAKASATAQEEVPAVEPVTVSETPAEVPVADPAPEVVEPTPAEVPVEPAPEAPKTEAAQEEVKADTK